MWERIKAHPVASGVVGSLIAAVIYDAIKGLKGLGKVASALWSALRWTTGEVLAHPWLLYTASALLLLFTGSVITLLVQQRRVINYEGALPEPKVRAIDRERFEYPYREGGPPGAIFVVKVKEVGWPYAGMPGWYLERNGIRPTVYVDSTPRCPRCGAEVDESRLWRGWLWRCVRAGCNWSVESPVDAFHASQLVEKVAGLDQS